ncbi:MAG TPA: hypothetical protein VLB49_03780 [Gemmatimonadales bacterium]|jgi:hypothetical protein|nr:hypothetical protein [Gemmatimonadales bacterium]
MVFTLLGAAFSVAQAQREPPVDSLIANFIERGTLSSWGPYQLFIGCPALKDWQERGFRQLASADLSWQRTNELAGAWAGALRDCSDRRLEQWYFEHLNAAIRRGEGERMYRFWVALSIADSPPIRDYLRGVMLDVSMPESGRNGAGTVLFERFGEEERLREYLRAFETMRLPSEVAWGQTDILLKKDPDRLLREVGRLVSANPALGEQTAFTSVVESSVRFASAEARRGLGEALESGLERAGGNVSARSRTRLEGTAQWLKRPPR